MSTRSSQSESKPTDNLLAQQAEPETKTLIDLAAQINQAHDQVEQAFTSAMKHALIAGKFLLEAKTQLKHGEFKPWIRDNFEFSDRMARAYMRVAKEFPKLPDEERQRVTDMSLRGVLKLLASPKNKTTAGSDSPVINLTDVETVDLVAELETRSPDEAEKALLILVRKWADAAGNEIIVRPKETAAPETSDQTSDEEFKEDLLAIPPSLDRRDEASDTNHDKVIPPQSRNQENNNG